LALVSALDDDAGVVDTTDNDNGTATATVMSQMTDRINGVFPKLAGQFAEIYNGGISFRSRYMKVKVHS
jgi:hypothetical protein